MGIKLTTTPYGCCVFMRFLFIPIVIYYLCAVPQHSNERSKKFKVMNERFAVIGGFITAK